MTFIDTEVPPLLGEALDGLLFTCVACRITYPRPRGHPVRRAGCASRSGVV
jgi:hypothetical protein